MLPTEKSNFKKSDGPERNQWYWGINNNTNTHCHILEMIFDSLKVDSMKSYRKFIRKNITELCLEVGNMSDFFEQLNYIITTDSPKETKVNNIMNLRDHSGGTFINEDIAEVIYKAMTMTYIKDSMTKKQGGAGKTSKAKKYQTEEDTKRGGATSMDYNENCYRQVTKGKLGYSVEKCRNEDASSCKEKVEGCDNSNCSIEDPNNPGLYKNVSDLKKEFYNNNQIEGTKTSKVVQGKCLAKGEIPEYNLPIYRRTCNIDDLNSLCDLYETDPLEADKLVQTKVEEFKKSDRPICRQMIADFNIKLKGKKKDKDKECRKVKDAINKVLKKEGKALPKDEKACYRKITKGKLGLNIDKCSNMDADSCKEKVEGCEKSNCSMEDPDNPGLYKNINDMKKQLFQSQEVPGTKATPVIEGKCMEKGDLTEYKTSNFLQACEMQDLTDLCQAYENDPVEAENILKTKVEGYITNEKPVCRQMVGDFNRQLKGKDREKICKKITKEVEKKMEKQGVKIPPKPAKKCYRQVTKGKLGYSVEKCANMEEASCKEKVSGCDKGNCSVVDPENIGIYKNVSDQKKSLYAAQGSKVLEGKCLDKKKLPEYKLASYKSQCDIQDLNSICKEYEDNPGNAETLVTTKIDEYNTKDNVECPQMLGHFNKMMKGKKRQKECKKIAKESGEVDPKSGSLMSKMKMGMPSAKDMASKGMASAKMGMASAKKGMASAKKGMAGLAAMAENMPQQSPDSQFPTPELPKGFGNIGASFKKIQQSPEVQGLEKGLKSLGQKLGDELTTFSEKSKSESEQATSNLMSQSTDPNKMNCLPFLPQLIFPSVFFEFNIPLNLNDVLLIGFSVFPYIGWIFDIFMIFRALLERRWLYAILMVINWYHWFFWKVLTFGTANMDLGPLFKVFYMGPYASKYFNMSNVANTFVHFVSEMTGNMPKMITITN